MDNINNFFTIGDTSFTLKLPNIIEPSVASVIKDWIKISEKSNDVVKKDVWSSIPQFPNYRFKNLVILDDSKIEEDDGITFKLQYDEYEKCDNICINIWDDFYEDGYVPEGEIQETYGYVEESTYSDDECK